MKRLLPFLLLFAADALAAARPPSVLAEAYGRNGAELASCGGAGDVMKQYVAQSQAAIRSQARKPSDAATNIQIFQESYKDEAARYTSGKDSASCSDIQARVYQSFH